MGWPFGQPDPPPGISVSFHDVKSAKSGGAAGGVSRGVGSVSKGPGRLKTNFQKIPKKRLMVLTNLVLRTAVLNGVCDRESLKQFIRPIANFWEVSVANFFQHSINFEILLCSIHCVWSL